MNILSRKFIRDNFHLISLAIVLGVTTLSSNLSTGAEALNYEELIRTRGPRNIIWAFDANGFHHNYTLPDQSIIRGIGSSFSAGYGRTKNNSWVLGRVHFLAGPWETARGGAFDADFSGSGIDIEYGMTFPDINLRSGSAPILTIAAGYFDLSGRNIGANRKSNGNPNESSNYYLEQEFKTNFGAVVVTPAIGWSWAKPERPNGNEVELLATRVESSFLKFAAMIPVFSRSRVEVVKRRESDSITQFPTQITSTGMVRGYSVFLSAGVWLGI